MATCYLSESLLQDYCEAFLPGVNTVFIASKALVASVTKGGGTPSFDELVTAAVTHDALGAPAAAFYEFQPNDVSSYWGDNGAPAANGSLIYAPSVTMVFGKNDAETVNAIKLLGRNKLVAIVKENSGKYFLLGYDLGLKVTSAVYGSGTAYTDARGWTVTLAGASQSGSPEVAETVITSAIIVGL